MARLDPLRAHPATVADAEARRRFTRRMFDSSAPPARILGALAAAGFGAAAHGVQLGIFSEYSARAA